MFTQDASFLPPYDAFNVVVVVVVVLVMSFNVSI